MSGRQADHFGDARSHRPLPRLDIGIHVRGLGDLDPAGKLILATLTGRGHHRSGAIWVSHGVLPTAVDPTGVTAFELIELPVGGVEAIAHVGDSEFQAPLHPDEPWRYLVDDGHLDRSRITDLRDIFGLAALGAAIIITGDTDLLRIREHSLMKPLNLMTPEEAFILTGAWSRIAHAPFLAGSWSTTNGAYYWALARALTPAGWPALGALSELARQSAHDRYLFLLAASVIDRLASTGRCLDRMLATWQCDANEEILSELLDDFDRAILNSWAIYDNLALLAGHSLRIQLRSRLNWTLLNTEWQARIAEKGDPRAGAIVAMVRTNTDHLAASQAIRHQLAHRTRLQPAPVSRVGRRPIVIENPWVWLDDEEGTLAKLDRAIEQTGTTAADWGIIDRLPPRRDTIGIVGADGGFVDAFDVELGDQAVVDPLVLALRICTHAAWSANEIFRLLDPASDPRLADPMEHRTLPVGARSAADYFLPRAANAALLASPFSGLVDWALSLAET